MSSWSKEELEKTLLEVKKKAIRDADFRKLALLDAASAVKEVAGKDLPSGVKLKFAENDGAHMTIVLPDMVEGEMSEDDLDKVAGGTATSVSEFCTTVCFGE